MAAELDGIPPGSAPRVKEGRAWNDTAFHKPRRDSTAFLVNWAIDQEIKGPGELAVERSRSFLCCHRSGFARPMARFQPPRPRRIVTPGRRRRQIAPASVLGSCANVRAKEARGLALGKNDSRSV